jgi:hypothetical protein
MLSLLNGIHAIAARRGDGLHPELVRLLQRRPVLAVDQPATASEADENSRVGRDDLILAPADSPLHGHVVHLSNRK